MCSPCSPSMVFMFYMIGNSIFYFNASFFSRPLDILFNLNKISNFDFFLPVLFKSQHDYKLNEYWMNKQTNKANDSKSEYAFNIFFLFCSRFSSGNFGFDFLVYFELRKKRNFFLSDGKIKAVY